MAKKTSKSAKNTTKTAAKPASKAATKKATQTEKPETARVAVTSMPQARDPRLPAPGTVLQKKDRQGNVRCECTVEDDCIRYKGAAFRSLSAAAMAASKDLGLSGGANGFLFWGVIKQAPRSGDPAAALEHAWERFRERAKGIMAGDLSADLRHQLQDVLLKQSQELASIG
jgi:hypothetical protein